MDKTNLNDVIDQRVAKWPVQTEGVLINQICQASLLAIFPAIWNNLTMNYFIFQTYYKNFVFYINYLLFLITLE